VLFDHFNAEGLRYALSKLIQLYAQDKTWKQIRRQGMACEFSWDAAARQYVLLYQRLLA
jgi:starch synthase